MRRLVFYSGLVLVFFILVSCDKGYQVRFTNFYIEPMDSVIVGNNKIVYKDVALETTTDYYKLAKGKYAIRFITKTKKNFYSSISIPSKGTGKRTIQIDGIEQVSIFEEE